VTKSIVRRATIVAPHFAGDADRPPPRLSDIKHELDATAEDMARSIADIRRTVERLAPDQQLPGSDADLEALVFDDAMLAQARATHKPAPGHMTRRLTMSRRNAKARVDAVISLRLARRPFAIVQAKVLAVHKPGRILDVVVGNGPDTGLAVRLDLGLAFPWDVLLRAL
jgi:hypothetical protein